MAKQVLLWTLCLILTITIHQIVADLIFPTLPTNKTYEDLGMKCYPGRTIIKIEDINQEVDENDDEEVDGNEINSLRNHMGHEATKDESCKICVCSVDGSSEYCSRRPAANVNECLRLAKIMDDFNKDIPYSHYRDLAQMIRRDMIWFSDDIPYDSKDKCYRGHSYYTNDPSANDTDLESSEDEMHNTNSLSYKNTSICFFCICSVSGQAVSCISRDKYFCDYHRDIDRPNTIRDEYNAMFDEDRPTYFQTLSFRLRRTMDDGLYELLTNVQSRRDMECIPFISEYTDCTEDNQCTGCTRCDCTSEAKWQCNKVFDCPRSYNKISHKSLNNAFNLLLTDVKNKHYKPNTVKVIPQPGIPRAEAEDLILDKEDLEGKIIEMMARRKRSIKSHRDESSKTHNSTNESEGNGTIKFYNTIDELNEDTLSASNATGTIQAAKVDVTHILTKKLAKPKANTNGTGNSALQIEYSNPHQNADRKVSNDNKGSINVVEQAKIGILTNYTQQEKDSDLSKMVVNELDKGKIEFIGEKGAPIMSNITFTPENDTLTAMAFIAGNLLNKLWSMEKDSSDESMEIETMKTEKIQDLLDLFKEPLNMRQEAFIKNTLETLTRALEQKDSSNLTLCEVIADAKKFINESINGKKEKNSNSTPEKDSRKSVIKEAEEVTQRIAKLKAVEKLNNVLSLMKKYENVHKKINGLKSTKPLSTSQIEEPSSGDENESLSVFGRLLSKITKLILPQKSNKKMLNKIRSLNMFSDKDDKIKKKIKDTFKIDVGNVTLTVKDKAILDYLLKIKSNPKSLLEDHSNNDNSATGIEGDILLNLSEFFKIKSFVELMKLVENKTEKTFLRTGSYLTTQLVDTTTEAVTRMLKSNIEEDIKSITTNVIDLTTTTTPKYGNAKDKLKAHLKTILDDIVELQKESGKRNPDGPLRIADALPCIYNILKDDNELNTSTVNDKPISPFEKLAVALEEIKLEYNATKTTSRRMGNENKNLRRNKPKSMQVWQRVISNVHEGRRNDTTRRNFEFKIPLIETIFEKIESLDDKSSDSYKLDISDVALDDQKIYLKKMYSEIFSRVSLLRDIKSSLNEVNMLPPQKQGDIESFIDNFAFKINSNKKVKSDLEKSRNKKKISSEFKALSVPEKQNLQLVKKENMKLGSEGPDKDIKLTRDEVLNQLIKNRVSQYLKLKKGKDETDQFYSIGRTILKFLEIGDYPFARQLYKIFVAGKQQNSLNAEDDKKLKFPMPMPRLTTEGLVQNRRQSKFIKEGLIHFEDPKPSDELNINQLRTSRRDQLLKNLLNSKNFRMV